MSQVNCQKKWSGQMIMHEVDYRNTRAYIVGGGIASLACAVYLVREGHLSGEKIYILEQGNKIGGALDGSGSAEEGFLIRGGRMHEKHFGCTWDLLSGIPTLNDVNKSVTQEIFEFNEKIVSCSTSRLLKEGKKVDVSSYGLSKRDQYDMLKLIFHSEADIGNKRIEDWFSSEFFNTVFWFLWSTTFAFQTWSSVVEMKRYYLRFMHLLSGFNQLKGIMRTRYNQHDSIILPVETWLREQGVKFLLDTQVTDVDFEMKNDCKTVTAIHYKEQDKQGKIDLLEDDFAFITLGSMAEDSSIGSMTSPAIMNSQLDSGAWALWNKIARNDAGFGAPGVFCEDPDLSKWMSFTVTLKDPAFFDYMEQLTGNVAGTGGLVTLTDSNWLMSVVLAWQPHFMNQPEGVFVFWGDGLLPDKTGNYVQKKMSDCSGEEILVELFSHLRIMDMMKPQMGSVLCIPCMMPYIDSQFMPRSPGDRPLVVPDGSTNFAFLGQFVEVPHDCVFTVEYSVRTAQMAVYSLLNLDKEVTPIYEGSHDIHVLLDALMAVNR